VSSHAGTTQQSKSYKAYNITRLLVSLWRHARATEKRRRELFLSMRALILSGKQAFDNGLGVSFEVFYFFIFLRWVFRQPNPRSKVDLTLRNCQRACRLQSALVVITWPSILLTQAWNCSFWTVKAALGPSQLLLGGQMTATTLDKTLCFQGKKNCKDTTTSLLFKSLIIKK